MQDEAPRALPGRHPGAGFAEGGQVEQLGMTSAKELTGMFTVPGGISQSGAPTSIHLTVL